MLKGWTQLSVSKGYYHSSEEIRWDKAENEISSCVEMEITAMEWQLKKSTVYVLEAFKKNAQFYICFVGTVFQNDEGETKHRTILWWIVDCVFSFSSLLLFHNWNSCNCCNFRQFSLFVFTKHHRNIAICTTEGLI